MKASLDKKPARPLTAADLCDRCSVRAAVETVMMQGGAPRFSPRRSSLRPPHDPESRCPDESRIPESNDGIASKSSLENPLRA